MMEIKRRAWAAHVLQSNTHIYTIYISILSYEYIHINGKHEKLIKAYMYKNIPRRLHTTKWTKIFYYADGPVSIATPLTCRVFYTNVLCGDKFKVLQFGKNIQEDNSEFRNYKQLYCFHPILSINIMHTFIFKIYLGCTKRSVDKKICYSWVLLRVL